MTARQKYNNLPDWIKDRFNAAVKKQFSNDMKDFFSEIDSNKNIPLITSFFLWDKTIEGVNFWEAVECGEYEKARTFL